jgi:hypothetical protein
MTLKKLGIVLKCRFKAFFKGLFKPRDPNFSFFHILNSIETYLNKGKQPQIWVARFLMVQHTKTGGKYNQMTIKYNEEPQNTYTKR